MSGGEVRLVAVVGFLLLLFSPANNRASGSSSSPSRSSVLLPRARVDGRKEEGQRGLDGGSYAGTLWLDPWCSVALAAAPLISSLQYHFYNNRATQSRLCATLICRRAFCSSLVSIATVVVDKKQGRSRELAAVWVRAHQRWRSQRGYGARGGGCQLAYTAPSSFLLAEGRLYFFLPADVQKGRQLGSYSESMASTSGVGGRRRSSGGLGIPSGLVPGDGKAESLWELSGTRLCFPFSIQGPSCIVQGLVCNILVYLGP